MKLESLKNCLAPRAIALAGMLAGGLPLATPARGTPVCDDDGGAYVCVDKGGANPIVNVDFSFNFADPNNPDVEFLTGASDWEVWSQVSSSDTTPANLGDLTIDATVLSDEFHVKIANGKDAGAVYLRSLVLKDPDSLWTGNSSILSGSKISANLYGAFEVVDNGSGGGYADGFTIEGNVTADIKLPHAAGFTIEGALYGAHLSAGDVTNGTLRLGSAEDHAIVSISSLVNGIFQVDAGTGGGTAADLALFTISSMDSSSSIRVAHTQTPGAESISLDLLITSDVPSGATIDLSNARYAKGAIVMGIAGQYDMLGDIDVYEWDAGFLGADLGGDFTVTDDFATASPGFQLTGDLTATGSIDVGGDFTSGAINLDGAAAGNILIAGAGIGTIDVAGVATGDVHVSGDATGAIDVGKLGRAGRILVDGLTNGPITVDDGTVRSSFIHLNGGLGTNGSLVIDDVSGGLAPVGANGDIQIGPDLPICPYPGVTFLGCVKVVSNLNGDIDVNGCHPNGTPDLSICVQGNTNGSVNVNECLCAYPIGGVDSDCLPACP